MAEKISIHTKPWTNEEEALLYEMRWNGITYPIIAMKLGRSVYSCKNKYRGTRWEEKSFFDAAKGRLKENIKRTLVDKITEAKEQKISSTLLQSEILADRLESSIKALPNVPRPVYHRSSVSAKQKHSPEDVGLILSDMHIGSHYTLEETGGLSEYNFDIFKKRIKFLTTATTDIVELHSRLYDLPNLHIFCPGDIVAGGNGVGAWSSTYINMPIWDQVIEGVDAIASMIYYWLTLFDNVYFYGVYGNHGRCQDKGQEKEYVNWDYICYKFLESRFKENPRVHFVVPKSWFVFTEIRNHKFMMVHGDDIKGGGIKGLLIYSDKMIGVMKKIPDYIIAGHFHSAAEITTSYGRLILNGSFTGGDMYALKNLQKSSNPEQKIFGIHDRRGITWSYNLNLLLAR